MDPSVQTTDPVDPVEQPATDPAGNEAPPTEPATDPAGPADDGLDSLPESWQREVKQLRKENADRRTRSNELQALLDAAKTDEDITAAVQAAVETHQAQVAELERAVSIQRHTRGLPDEAAELVTGTTDDEIKASAEKVRKLLEGAGAPGDPDLDASGGLDPRGPRSGGSAQSPRELARAALSSGRR